MKTPFLLGLHSQKLFEVWCHFQFEWPLEAVWEGVFVRHLRDKKCEHHIQNKLSEAYQRFVLIVLQHHSCTHERNFPDAKLDWEI
jgi:hypothetical protein